MTQLGDYVALIRGGAVPPPLGVREPPAASQKGECNLPMRFALRYTARPYNMITTHTCDEVTELLNNSLTHYTRFGESEIMLLDC